MRKFNYSHLYLDQLGDVEVEGLEEDAHTEAPEHGQDGGEEEVEQHKFDPGRNCSSQQFSSFWIIEIVLFDRIITATAVTHTITFTS